MMEMFCILIVSVSVSWLRHCTKVLQEVNLGRNLVKGHGVSIIFLQLHVNLHLSQKSKV